MGLRFMKIVCLFLGCVLGYAIALILGPILDNPPGVQYPIPNQPGIVIVFGLLGYMVATVAYRWLLKFNEWFLKLILQSNGPKMVNGIIGGGLGFVFALLLNVYFIETLFISTVPTYNGFKILAFLGTIVIGVYLGAFFPVLG